MKCKHCGKEIESVLLDKFNNYDGSDRLKTLNLQRYEQDKFNNADHVATPRWVVENIYSIIDILITFLEIIENYEENRFYPLEKANEVINNDSRNLIYKQSKKY